jgi:signal transduction histidine kinase
MINAEEKEHQAPPLSLKNLAYGVTALAFLFIIGVSMIIALDLQNLTQLAQKTRIDIIPEALKQHEKALQVRQLGLFSDIMAESDTLQARDEALAKALTLTETLKENTSPQMKVRLDDVFTDITLLKSEKDSIQKNRTEILSKVRGADLGLYRANTLLTTLILEKSERLQQVRKPNASALQEYLYASQLKNVLLSLRLRLASLKETATLAETYNEESFFNGLLEVAVALIDNLPAWEKRQEIRKIIIEYKELSSLFVMQREALALIANKPSRLRKINETLALIAGDITSNASQLASEGATKIANDAEATLKKTQVAFSMLAAGFLLLGLTIRLKVVQPIVKAAGALRSIAKHQFVEVQLLPQGNLEEIIEINKGVQQLSQSLQAAAENNEKLLALTQAKNYFVSSVSHELKTPLTTIYGFSRRITDDFSRFIAPVIENDAGLNKKSERIISNLDIIIKETDRLNRLIDDVLDVARIDAGRMPWNDKQVNIIEVIHFTKQATAEEFAKKPAVRLVLDLPQTLPTLLIDPDRLQQVLINLLVNAIKFTDAGTVTLKCWAAEAHLYCSITDTGMGIREEDFDKIFRRFQQASIHEDNLKNKPKGTGLGLAISRQIVEHYKGTITLASVFGQGTTFTITLPLDEKTA